jgi:hypothetical protein
MKKLITIYAATVLLAALMLVFSSCQKGTTSLISTKTSSTTAVTSGVAVSNGNILIAATANTTATAKDSLLLMNVCIPGKKPDTIAFSALPSAIGTYLTANYAGYTFQKAFKIVNSASTLTGYVVVINLNGKPIGLKFDTTGTFVQVLEQRQPQDIDGPGWHPGGCFDNRDGLHPDTIAISALPTTIKSYFTANYPTDTLLHAVVTSDTTYIVYSADKGLFATSFTSKLVFSKRLQLYPRPIKTPVLQTALPAAITTYLTTTYAGYVFDKAFVEKVNGTITKYVVLIDASGTRYAVQFDATGKFVQAITIR